MAGISSDIIRGYNDTIILYLLLDKPSYGYEISKQIKAMTNEKYIVKETTLYSAFTRMERMDILLLSWSRREWWKKSAPIIRLLTKDGCIISQNVKSGLLLKKLSKNLL